MIVQVRWRRGTSAEWAAANPRLAIGEPGFDETLGRFKIGNGTTPWVNLPYAAVSPLEMQATLAQVDQAVIEARAARDAAIAAANSIGNNPGGGGTGLIVDPTDIGTFNVVDDTVVVIDETDPGTFTTDADPGGGEAVEEIGYDDEGRPYLLPVAQPGV